MVELTAPRPLSTVRPARMPPWATLGALFGGVSIAAILLFGPIGVSATYPRAIGELWRLVDPAGAAANPYLAKVGALLKPETMLVLGLLIGGFLASRLSGAPRAQAVEFIHAGEATRRQRYLRAFLGGVLIVFGARLAGGCTSGHIISGMTQLSVSAFIFTAGVFGAGIATAKLLKRRALS